MRLHKKKLYAGLLGFLLLGIAGMASAETMYVTDKLRLGLYAGAGASGERLELLGSGMALEILGREGNFARVRSEKGNEGWVKSAFLVSDKPAILVVEELTQHNADLMTRNEGLEAALKTEKDALTEQAETLKQTEDRLAAVQKELSALTGDGRNVFQRIIDDPALLIWSGALIFVFLILGAYLGHASYERKVRKRFYGFELDSP